jgi:hypothetical protein
MTGISFGILFSLFLVMLVTTVLFVYTWMSSHGRTYVTNEHLDLRAGDEGED